MWKINFVQRNEQLEKVKCAVCKPDDTDHSHLVKTYVLPVNSCLPRRTLGIQRLEVVTP